MVPQVSGFGDHAGEKKSREGSFWHFMAHSCLVKRVNFPRVWHYSGNGPISSILGAFRTNHSSPSTAVGKLQHRQCLRNIKIKTPTSASSFTVCHKPQSSLFACDVIFVTISLSHLALIMIFKSIDIHYKYIHFMYAQFLIILKILIGQRFQCEQVKSSASPRLPVIKLLQWLPLRSFLSVGRPMSNWFMFNYRHEPFGLGCRKILEPPCGPPPQSGESFMALRACRPLSHLGFTLFLSFIFLTNIKYAFSFFTAGIFSSPCSLEQDWAQEVVSFDRFEHLDRSLPTPGSLSVTKHALGKHLLHQ